MVSVGADESPDSGGTLGTGFTTLLMARILAALFGAGATLALATILLPHSEQATEAGLAAVCIGAYLTAAALWRSEELPDWGLPVALAWGTVCITGVAHFSGEAPSPLAFFYLWVFLYSAYFFTRREAILQVVFVGIAFAVLLASAPPAEGSPIAWWLVGMGAMTISALVIGTMRERVEQLIERLYATARRDPLTELSNRRGFRELFDLELEAARRTGGTTAVVVGDIDHFKQVNDISGHHVGDRVLKQVAGLLSECKRPLDAVARVGGEEFALILPGTDADAALALTEQLRISFQERFREHAVPITMSFGIALYPHHGQTAASLLRAADEALYSAKESGRNCCVMHRPALRAAAPEGAAEEGISSERFIGVMLDLAEAVDLRFSGSARHSETVGRYAEMMARGLGLPEERVSRVRLAGMLHDIGKATIPDAILHKPGALTDEEFETIKTHPGLGAQILEHRSLRDVREWVRSHHERPDGRGYPEGLAGEQISVEARIVSVADAYEAMTSTRSYRSSMSPTEALAELQRHAGSQFDPAVVEAFSSALGSEPVHSPAVLAHG
jgi:diguanylate cyclase (GGDEF)-like protein/putative nucleotidyltransferase with HDIG domain